MSQAKSHVQVTIGGKLDPTYQNAFTTADKRMQALGQHATDLNKKVGDIGAYRRQQNALKDVATEYTKAKAKVAALKAELVGVEKPTRAQAAALNAAERAAARAGSAYTQARTKLADMGRELQRSGVNVTKLSTEYRRLQTELSAANLKFQKHEASLKRQQSIVNGMRTAWQAIGGIATGAMAAGAVAAAPTRKALTYEEQLAYMADTAGAGQSPAAKAALQKQFSEVIEKARQYSKGASREGTASALQTLIASGLFDGGAAIAELPKVARTAFASGADEKDVANIAIAAKNFGVKDMQSVFDKSLRAGQLGRNELRDMAPALPKQMAVARAAGMYGEQGLTDLLAFNQAAMLTAGTAGEANTNVENLLKKFTTAEFKGSIAKNIKVQKGDPYTAGKKGAKEFDWPTYLVKQREKGIDPISAFGGLLERQMAGNKQYQNLQKKVKAAGSDEEKKAVIGQMSSIVEGSAVGQIIADSEALKAALASLYGKKSMGEMKTQINQSKGFVDQSAEFLGSQNFAGAKMLGGNLDRANEQAYSQLEGPLKSVIDTLNGATQQFPKLTTAAYEATTALGTIAAFVAGNAIFGKLIGGGAGAGAGAGGAAGAAAAGAAASRFGLLGRLGVAGVASWGALQVGEMAGLPNVDEAKGREALAKGEWLKASAYLPAGAFLGALYNKATGGPAPAAGQGGPAAAVVVSSSEAAKQASAAAQEAAKAATTAAGRPNVNITNSYNVQVTAPQPGAAELAAQLDRTLKAAQRKADADARSSFLGQPNY